jgi:hypothetical protein
MELDKIFTTGTRVILKKEHRNYGRYYNDYLSAGGEPGKELIGTIDCVRGEENFSKYMSVYDVCVLWDHEKERTPHLYYEYGDLILLDPLKEVDAIIEELERAKQNGLL